MNYLEITNELAILRGDSGNGLITGNFKNFNADEICLDVSVYSSWYAAKITVITSSERLKDFMEKLKSFVSLKEKNINFINEKGNFDLDIIANTTGSVEIKGIISGNMLDDLQLSFGFSSTMKDIENFYRDLSSFHKSL